MMSAGQRYIKVFFCSLLFVILNFCTFSIYADDQTETASQVVKVISPELKLFGNSAQLGEGFMVLDNEGKLPHTLVAVHSEIAQETVLHQTYLNEGKPMMQQIRQIDILPKNEQTLEGRGLHIMLINIDQQVKPGSTVPIMLLFKDGSELTVSAKIV